MGELHTGQKHPLSGTVLLRPPSGTPLDPNQKERVTVGIWRSIIRLTPDV